MLSRARRGVCEIVAGAALWRCRCEIVAGAALWRCRCRSRGRRSILCIWVCVCVAGVAFGSCLEGQVARAAGGVRNRGRRSTLAMPLRNRGRRSTLAMPLPKSWQAQHSVHLGVCLCGRGRIRQLSRGAAVFADSDCQCSMVLYHDHVELALQEQGYSLPNPCKDTAELRSEVRDAFRSALWTCKVTFRENDYQQILELECRHLTPFLPFNKDCPDLTPHMLELPRCSLGGGCPVAALRDLRVDTDLGSLTIQEIDAPSVRALVMFNEVQLPDDESLQQDPQSASAVRVKRSVDCCLSVPDAETLLPFRSKIRAAGPASAVNWILRARPGEVHQVVIMQADAENEWSVLWHVEVHEKAVLAVNAYYSHIISKQTAAAALSYASEWTPGKRVRTLRDSMPTPFKTSSAWQDHC